MMSLIQDRGNGNQAVAKTLLAMSEDDDEWYAYLEISNDPSVQDPATHTRNEFGALVNAVPSVYDDEDAREDVEMIMENITEQFAGQGNLEDPSPF